jgi:hypothetical protein
MVGWTRRNRESSERRAKWWAILSEEQKQQWQADQPRRDACERKIFRVVLPICLILYISFWTIMLSMQRK